METTLFDKKGEAAGYIAADYNTTIYLWDGSPVAYLHNEQHLYGINGRHLGWLIDGIIYDHSGARVGFLFNTCPVSTFKEPVKGKRRLPDQIRPKWAAPPLTKLTYSLSGQDLTDFLKEGQVRYREEAPPEEPQETEG
ncbi:MAG: 4-fold beta flower protein [Pseudomonadota bacterium]